MNCFNWIIWIFVFLPFFIIFPLGVLYFGLMTSTIGVSYKCKIMGKKGENLRKSNCAGVYVEKDFIGHIISESYSLKCRLILKLLNIIDCFIH